MDTQNTVDVYALNDAQLRALNKSCEREVLRYMQHPRHTAKRTARAFAVMDIMEKTARELARREHTPAGPTAVSYETMPNGATYRFTTTVLCF